MNAVLGTFKPQDFAAAYPVSRETLARLEAYVDLLETWNRTINLIGKNTLDDLWRRHILDSAQLSPLLPPGAALLDIGSGAGFPGLVLAILGHSVTLVEQDQRKAAFLREAARISGATVAVEARPLSRVAPFAASVITARAFSPLPVLLEMVEPFIGPGTVALLLKGREVGQELVDAAARWTMAVTETPSRSDPSGVILRLDDIARKPAKALSLAKAR